MDRLLFNFLWTVWIVIGSYLEEIDLIAEFGDAYRDYQKRVPMLVPFLKWQRGNGALETEVTKGIKCPHP